MERYRNIATTTLNGAIDDSQTTLVVTSASLFPSDGDFRIKIETELMLVTGVSGTTFTVTRGIEGSTAAAHSNGTALSLPLTAASFQILLNEYRRTGVIASRPSAEILDRWYIPDNRWLIEYDTGSDWGNLNWKSKVNPPVSTDFSWVNQGLATVTDRQGIIFSKPIQSSMSKLERSIPSSPFTVTIATKASLFNSGFPLVGLYLWDSTNSRTLTLCRYSNAQLRADRWANHTSISTAVFNNNYMYRAKTLFLRLKESGTNILCESSLNNLTWVTHATEPKASWLSGTISNWGLFVYNSSSADIKAHFYHYSEV